MVSTADGPVRGTVRGDPFSGNFAVASAGMIADATGPNPSGSATWTGLGEAASTRTFNRHSGTTSLTIPDLADPRIDAEIPSPAPALGRGTACEWTEAVSAQVRPASIGSMAYWLALAMKKLGGI